MGAGGKPYCIRHLHYMPEVQRIHRELAQIDAEWEELVYHGALDPGGILAAMSLDLLAHMRDAGSAATLEDLTSVTAGAGGPCDELAEELMLHLWAAELVDVAYVRERQTWLIQPTTAK